jgi:hypothetical protein
MTELFHLLEAVSRSDRQIMAAAAAGSVLVLVIGVTAQFIAL